MASSVLIIDVSEVVIERNTDLALVRYRDVGMSKKNVQRQKEKDERDYELPTVSEFFAAKETLRDVTTLVNFKNAQYVAGKDA